MDLETAFLRLTSRSEGQRQHGADASPSHLSQVARDVICERGRTRAGVHAGAGDRKCLQTAFFFSVFLSALEFFYLMAFSSKTDSFYADCKDLRGHFLPHGPFLSAAQHMYEYKISGRMCSTRPWPPSNRGYFVPLQASPPSSAPPPEHGSPKARTSATAPPTGWLRWHKR